MANMTSSGQVIRDDSNAPVGWNYAYTTATGATVIKNVRGMLHTLTINSVPTGTIVSLYDNATTTTKTIASLTVPQAVGNIVAPISLRYDVVFVNGLVLNIGTTGSLGDVTISFI